MARAMTAHRGRLAAAQRLLPERNSSALLIGVGADLRYLTGYEGHPSERPTILVLTAERDPVIVAPRLEAMGVALAPAVSDGPVAVRPWDETDDPYLAVRGLIAADGRVLVNADLWARHLLGLQRAMPAATWGLAADVMRDLRIRKDAAEIELLRAAAEAADRVLDRIAGGPLIGRTELEVSRHVRDRLVAEGHDEASFAIVASGPNSASPHHQPSERMITEGDPVVLDIGGRLGGYCSDTTRTIWVAGPSGAEPPAELVEIHRLVAAAQSAATAAVRPGVACAELDDVARRVIRDGGHGEAFIHRLGHGIGLEGHEDPYLVAGNTERLEPGMAFSNEPGIYLEGRFGVRIEDVIVCGSDGADVLNRSSRELRRVEG